MPDEKVQLSELHSEIDATVLIRNVFKQERTNIKKKSTDLNFLWNVATNNQCGGPENTKTTKEARPMPQM